MLWETFRSDVERGFGSLLQTQGFVEEEYLKEEYKRALFYRSARCKICVFESLRERDINCVLAKRGTKNSTYEKDGWYPYRLLLHRAGVDLRVMDPLQRPSREEIFREYGSELESHFNEAVSALEEC